MEADNLKEKAEDLVNHTTDYLDTFYKLSVLKISKKATNFAAMAMGAFVAFIIGILLLFFGGLSLGWWLGNVIESRAGGFLIVALFFLLIGISLILLRKKIIFPLIRNLFIRRIYE